MSFLDNISQCGEMYANSFNKYANHCISEMPSDHTYIGRVVDKETYKDTYSNQTLIKRWLIAANGKSYYVNVENADIKSVGQSVRLYIPNNNKDKAFAEVINPATAPDKIVYTKDDTSYSDYREYGVDKNRKIKYTENGIEKERNMTKDDVVIDTIVETWNLADKTELTRLYIMTVINADTSDEEVTSMVCPDGKQIMLEGFIIG